MKLTQNQAWPLMVYFVALTCGLCLVAIVTLCLQAARLVHAGTACLPAVSSSTLRDMEQKACSDDLRPAGTLPLLMWSTVGGALIALLLALSNFFPQRPGSLLDVLRAVMASFTGLWLLVATGMVVVPFVSVCLAVLPLRPTVLTWSIETTLFALLLPAAALTLWLTQMVRHLPVSAVDKKHAEKLEKLPTITSTVVLGVRLLLAIGLLTTAWIMYTRRVNPVPQAGFLTPTLPVDYQDVYLPGVVASGIASTVLAFLELSHNLFWYLRPAEKPSVRHFEMLTTHVSLLALGIVAVAAGVTVAFMGGYTAFALAATSHQWGFGGAEYVTMSVHGGALVVYAILANVRPWSQVVEDGTGTVRGRTGVYYTLM